ncbi:peptidase dimerization domain-containing protein [Virgibacillus oceani]
MFVEVHIEQEKRLENEGLPCGIVTGIAGPVWIEFTFNGEAGYAGNTPMNDRRDALVAASKFVSELKKLPPHFSKSAVATVGKLYVEPNGVNVIPGKVTLYVDVRDTFNQSRNELVVAIISLGKTVAHKHHVEITYEENLRVAATPIAKETQQFLA